MIVPILDTCGSISSDPLEVHTRPALDRMRRAERALRVWRWEGLNPHVVWNPHVEIVSGAGETLAHPIGCLPELLWLMRRDSDDCWTVPGREGAIFTRAFGTGGGIA
jgi:hypothetical protein